MERLSGMWDLYINQGMESDGGLLRVLLNVLPAMCFLILRKKVAKIRWPDSYRFLLCIVCRRIITTAVAVFGIYSSGQNIII